MGIFMKRTLAKKFKAKQIRLAQAVAARLPDQLADHLTAPLRLKKALRSVQVFHSKHESYPWSRDDIHESEILG
jgi:hypothetical protein